MSTEQTAAEYFAGIGLVRMGLEPCGWRVVFANDISQKKYDMYRAFYSDADQHYHVADVFDVRPDSVPQAALATCSFPCIDLSLAGNMSGIGGKHSSAFWGFTQILKAQKEQAPPLVLVENVPGWLHSNKGADFRVAVQALNHLGYRCDVFTLNARSFTPQSRLRVFLVGTRRNAPNQNPDLALARPSSLLSQALKRSLRANSDLKWFSLDLPEPPPLRTRGLSEIVEKMDDSDDRWWTDEQVKRHLDMMADSHRSRVEKLRKQDEIAYRTFFRRRRKGMQRAEVRRDDVAGCLRTAVGGSAKQFLIEAGNENVKMRTMTAREYARLQGVPDMYPINVNGVQALTGFGDAVCVPAITWIAENALNPLFEILSAGEP